MNPPPQCKTAIISFIIDKIPKLWNISSNTRKRMQMIIGDRDITVSKYSPKAFIINGWVRVGTTFYHIKSIQDMKKGISNYKLTSQEQFDKIISLNGALRCHKIDFTPQKPFHCESIDIVEINLGNCDFYQKCTFGRINRLDMYPVSEEQIEYFLSKTKRVNLIRLMVATLPELDLTKFKIKELYLNEIKGTVSLPSSLEALEIDHSEINSLKNITRNIKKLSFCMEDSDDEYSHEWISNFKGLKIFIVPSKISEYIDYLSSTLRCIEDCQVDEDNIDLVKVKEKLPYLIRIKTKLSIEIAQTLNLRDIEPIMTQTEKLFTLKPRRIDVSNDNVEELNKHPELFERVEQYQFIAKDSTITICQRK